MTEKITEVPAWDSPSAVNLLRNELLSKNHSLEDLRLFSITCKCKACGTKFNIITNKINPKLGEVWCWYSGELGTSYKLGSLPSCTELAIKNSSPYFQAIRDEMKILINEFKLGDEYVIDRCKKILSEICIENIIK